MKKKLFVALSHQLTSEQIADFDGEIVLLSTVSPELAAECSNINPNVSISHIQHLAAQIAVLACLAECTHFCCQGEPGLAMWANMFASGNMTYHYSVNKPFYNCGDEYIQLSKEVELFPQMTCITSTTQRQSIDEYQADGSVVKKVVFKHVMWRELF